MSWSNRFFTGIVAALPWTGSLQQSFVNDRQGSFFCSGPDSGTWTATVKFWRLREDGSLALIASSALSNSGPNVDGTATRTYDALELNIAGGSSFVATVESVTGTIPAPGLYAEVN